MSDKIQEGEGNVYTAHSNSNYNTLGMMMESVVCTAGHSPKFV